MAYDKNVSFGTFDTPYEAALARARVMGLPPPVRVVACTPVPAQHTTRVDDRVTLAVRQWYEAQWTRCQQWHTGTVPQEDLRNGFCAASDTPTEHISVRKFGKVLRACFAAEVKAAPHRWMDGRVRSCWFFTPETACPAHLLAAWKERRDMEKTRAAERQRAAQEERERKQAEDRRRQQEEEDEEERLRLEDEREWVCDWLKSKGLDVNEHNIEYWMDLDDYDPCVKSDD